MIRPIACLLLLAVSCTLFCGCDDTYVPPAEPTARSTVPPPPAGAAPPPPPVAKPVKPEEVNPEPNLDDLPSPFARNDDPEPDDETEEGEEPVSVQPVTPVERPMTADEARAQLGDLGGRFSDDDAGLPAKVFLNRTDINDQQVSVIQHLSGVEILNLTGTRVGDAGLSHVHGLTGLKRIYAAHTDISDEGVRQLKEAIPDCEIYR